MADEKNIKALETLEKFEFFGGQRAGRELWANKPTAVQDEDIDNFNNDVNFLKEFIESQQKRIEELENLLSDRCDRCIEKEKESAIRAFAESIVEQLEEAAYEPEQFEYENYKVVDLEDAIGFVKGVE